MTSHPEADDVAAIRHIFDNWFAGTSSRDIDRVMQGIAHDIVSYEHDVPLQHIGIDAVRGVCQRGLDMSGPGTAWCVPETTILVRDDIAVQWGLNRMRFSAEDGSTGESWSRGTRVFRKGKDGWEMVLEAVTENHTSDVVMFDVPPPVAHRGLEAYRGTWPPFFEWQRQSKGRFEITSLEVTAGADVAFAVAVLRCGTQEALALDDSPTLRLTLGLRKEGGRWLIAHEHHSFPLEPET